MIVIIIKNANIYREDYKFHKGDLYIKSDKLVPYLDYDNTIIDEKDSFVIPGLTDVHFHGAAGFSFSDGTHEGIGAIAKYEAESGITQICPATVTLPEEALYRVSAACDSYANEEGAVLVGINMEGPFINKDKKGAQNEAYVKKPDIDMFNRINKLSGYRIKLVDLAPEVNGAMEFIEQVKDHVVVSIAHTTANYELALKAFDKGATHVTHLYNAMPPFTHRAPGVIGAAADTKDCMVELIGDGIHVHPSVVRATFRMFGDDRIILISDSMMATGMPDGDYTLGELIVTVKDKRATLKDGTIASSVFNLMDCVRSVVDMGIPLESAIKCAAVNPAKQIGVFDKYGSLESGKVANFVVLNKDLSLKHVYLNGKRYI